MSFKKCKVIMLATNKQATINDICFGFNGLQILTSKDGKTIAKCQHLYITSDEKIKEGNWYIDDCDKIRNSVTSDEEYWDRRFGYKKIIASTDPALYTEDTKDKLCGISFPKLSQSFIEKYIEEYNKGNIITEVIVEYEDNGSEEWFGDNYEGEPVWNEKIEPKVNSKDNTITIKKVKDSWTKDEVIIYHYWLRTTKFNSEGHSPEDCLNEFIRNKPFN